MDLTPEAQAVIDAAVAWATTPDGDLPSIDKAVTAYQESIKLPEPFTRYMTRFDDGQFAYNAWGAASNPDPDLTEWEVLITPIRKVNG